MEASRLRQAYEITDAEGNVMTLADDEEDGPRPDLTTAFDSAVWSTVANSEQLSAVELQGAIASANASETPKVGSEADFSSDHGE